MRSLHAKVDSYFLVNQDRPVEISSLVLADPVGKYWLDYGVLIDDPKLGQRDGSQLKLSISYRLTTASGETILENTEDRAYAAFEDGAFGRENNSRLSWWPAAFPLSRALTS